MEQEDLKKIEKVMEHFKCPVDFKCIKGGLKNLCKVADIGLDDVVECVEIGKSDCANECSFRISYGHSYYCAWPLRVYISKTLRK